MNFRWIFFFLFPKIKSVSVVSSLEEVGDRGALKAPPPDDGETLHLATIGGILQTSRAAAQRSHFNFEGEKTGRAKKIGLRADKRMVAGTIAFAPNHLVASLRCFDSKIYKDIRGLEIFIDADPILPILADVFRRWTSDRSTTIPRSG